MGGFPIPGEFKIRESLLLGLLSIHQTQPKATGISVAGTCYCVLRNQGVLIITDPEDRRSGAVFRLSRKGKRGMFGHAALRQPGLLTGIIHGSGWAEQTTASVGRRPLHEVCFTRRRAVRQAMGLRRPTNGLRGLGPPDMNNPG